jgi:hypothetical protein
VPRHDTVGVWDLGQRTEVAEMSFGVIHRFKGGTKEQYDRSLKKVHPDDGESLPAGQTFHVGAETDDGRIVIALWDSEESWVKFRDETLMPGLAETEGGLPSPPEETTFRIDKQQQA